MFSSTDLSSALRAVTDSMRWPVVFILLVLIALSVVMAGTLVAELFMERVRMKAKMPQLVDDIKLSDKPLADVIAGSGLLKRQKKALNELNSHPDITPAMRESLAVRLLEEERAHYNLIVMITDLTARIAPMFGLLGTLIPLGPGIIALGRGDTYTLSTSLLTAFNTTAVGLMAAAAAFIISEVRKRWYVNDMSALEMAMECILDVTGRPQEIQTGEQKDDDSEKEPCLAGAAGKVRKADLEVDQK